MNKMFCKCVNRLKLKVNQILKDVNFISTLTVNQTCTEKFSIIMSKCNIIFENLGLLFNSFIRTKTIKNLTIRHAFVLEIQKIRLVAL